MPIYDITLPIDTHLAIWPGDTPFAFSLSWSTAEGASVNVGTATMSVHTGTHIDAPFHFRATGVRAGVLGLSPYIGPAIVIDRTGQAEIGPDALSGVDLSRTPRVLFRTGAWPDPTHFPESVPTLTLETVAVLAAGGVQLVGLDVPSVDAIDSKDLPIHHALDAAGIRILESLRLADVPPGIYELIALPLKLMDADGSPVRAILRTPAVE